jgi:replication-associated recombination protein RarA
MGLRREIRTTRGYDFYEVASALQKAVRRGDARLAGYWAVELHESGYGAYAWRRLLTSSAEDCAGLVTTELEALYRSWETVRAANPRGTSVFIAKAVVLLCRASKSRDADHLACLVYNRKIGITDDQLLKDLEEARADSVAIPEYALDVHTHRGRMRGKTKQQFFIDEHDALEPRIAGLFDDVFEIVRKKTMREE